MTLRDEAARYAEQALSPSNREWYQRVVEALDEAERMRAALTEACNIALGTDLTSEAAERVKEILNEQVA